MDSCLDAVREQRQDYEVNFEIAMDAEGIARIRLSGRMDIQGTQDIELKFVSHTAVDRGRFVVDMRDVSFLASMGIRALIVVAKNVRARGGLIVLYGTNEQVTMTLETAGVSALIPLCGDLNQALMLVKA